MQPRNVIQQTTDEKRVAVESRLVASKSGNFTSRVAGWSAAHRKGVVRGWLAFVLLAFVVGDAAGLATADDGRAGERTDTTG